MNNFSGIISKHSSIGRIKDIKETDLMNVSAPVKISQYISNAAVKINKRDSISNKNNIFSSVTPKYNEERSGNFFNFIT